MAKKSAYPRSCEDSGPIRRILAIDIGGTGVKAAIVGPRGGFLDGPVRVRTPAACTPARMARLLVKLVKPLGGYDRVAIGFPGYVRAGRVFTAPHLGTRHWAGCAFADAMQAKLKKPVRLHNDADVQGLAVITGKGLELVCTLGTGLGTAWFRDGELMPHMDLAHMAIHAADDFDGHVGEAARARIGNKHWQKRVAKLIAMLETVFFYDRLYLGGGNARHVKFRLPPKVSLTSNDAGLQGGAFVWLPRSTARR